MKDIKMVVFDFGGVLSEFELHRYLAHKCGGEEAEENSRRWWAGEITFKQLYDANTLVQAGLTAEYVANLAKKRTKFTPGAKALLAFLKRRGIKTAAVSGEYQECLDIARGKLDLDYAVGNRAQYNEEGVHTGKIAPPLVDERRKALVFKEICRREGISPKDCVVVGHQWNDLPMMRLAGLSIAYGARSFVQEQADLSVATFTELERVLKNFLESNHAANPRTNGHANKANGHAGNTNGNAIDRHRTNAYKASTRRANGAKK